jgi:regulator of protease activity HflC (stomatin/prohibitin superfamily)
MKGGAALLGCLVCVGLGTATVLCLCSIRTVQPGHLGLVVTHGDVDEEPLSPGMHYTSPYAEVVEMSLKTEILQQHSFVPTREGLQVGLDVALLYHVNRESVYTLYTTVGDNYEAKVIGPLLSSELRGLTSRIEAKALYNEGRELVQNNLTLSMKDALVSRGIVVEKVLLKTVKLPDLLKSSIEAKAQAEQAAEQMKFVLQKEQQEAERKKIEASGIAEFQRIVTEGITPSLLQWKGIEATLKISDSKNSKLVIMGNTQASMPVLLSGDTAQTGSP